MDYHRDEGAWTKYARSKAGNVLQAAELARRSRKDGVVSVVSFLNQKKRVVRATLLKCISDP